MKHLNSNARVLDLFPTSRKNPKKIVLKTNESIYLIDLEEIIRCEADGNYTRFFLKDGKKITVSRTLKEFELLFNQHYFFFRLHQSHLINLNYMERFDKKEGGMVIMKDKTVIPVSGRKKGELLILLETF